jgi:hypothetical protein
VKRTEGKEEEVPAKRKKKKEKKNRKNGLCGLNQFYYANIKDLLIQRYQ